MTIIETPLQLAQPTPQPTRTMTLTITVDEAKAMQWHDEMVLMLLNGPSHIHDWNISDDMGPITTATT